MEQRIFRRKSMEKLRSPEQLDEYLHAEGPALWVVLIAVISLLVGIFFWSITASVDSFVFGDVEVKDQMMTFKPENEEDCEYIEEGMSIIVGENRSKIVSVGTDTNGNTVMIAETDLPDGNYSAKVPYDKTRIIELLF